MIKFFKFLVQRWYNLQ